MSYICRQAAQSCDYVTLQDNGKPHIHVSCGSNYKNTHRGTIQHFKIIYNILCIYFKVFNKMYEVVRHTVPQNNTKHISLMAVKAMNYRGSQKEQKGKIYIYHNY